MSVNTSWSPPPTSWMVFDDCEVASAWLAAYSALYVQGDISWDGVSINLVKNYLHSMIPSNWTTPTDEDLLLWYHRRTGGLDHGNVTYRAMIEFPLSNCSEEICPYLKWQGDPDLAGVGAMISYFILAIFTTLYFVVLLPSSFGHATAPDTEIRVIKHGRMAFVVSGFRKSLNTFQDAVLLFAISVNIAAMTRWAAPLVHPNDSHAFYGLLNSVFMSAFVIFPALALQALTPGLPHRRGIRLFLWTLVVVFAAVVEGLYRHIYLTDYFLVFWQSAVEFNEDIWLSNCDSRPLRVRLGYLTMAGHIFLTVDCCTWYVYQATATLRRGSRRVRALRDKVAAERRAWWRRRWERVQPYLRLGNGFASLVFMWLFLGLFTAYREGVRVRAGESDEDGEWTFGQVLSLTTWAPVAVELINVYLYEGKDPAAPENSPAARRQAAKDAETHSYHKRLFEEALETISLNEGGDTRSTAAASRRGGRDRSPPWSPTPSTPSTPSTLRVARTRDFV